MRGSEILLLALLAIASISFLIPATRRNRWVHFVPLFAVAVSVVESAVEGYRWQMVPAYLLAVLLALVTIPNVGRALRPGLCGRPADRKVVRRVGVAACLSTLVIAAAPPVLFPHFELPEPTGPYAVGTRDVYLVDTDRPETFTPDPDDHREVSLRIWYPAEALAGAKPVSYGEHAGEIGRILTRGTPLPRFVFDSFSLIESNSVRGADLAGGPETFPVLIFSHGYWAGISQSTVLMEELASHGYVVVSVGHAYETPYSIDPKGRVRAFDPTNDEFRSRGEERKRALPVERRLVSTHDPSELESLLRRLSLTRPKLLESLDIWSEDLRFTIDELERMNASDHLLAARLDTSRIGVLGHSFGGTASGEACLRDSRCKAGVNLDGLQIGSALEENLARPFMFVHHDNPTASNKTPNRLIFERAENAAYLLLVRGTRHLSFSDLSLQGRGSLMRLTGGLGDLDGRRCLRIQNEYVRAFFDKHLKDRDSGLLDGPSSDYPEVEIRVRAPRGFSAVHSAGNGSAWLRRSTR